MNNSGPYALPQESTILVTGANGYIASHVCNILLELGYRVRGSVRSEKPWLNRFFNEKYGEGRFSTILFPSLDNRDAWGDAVTGVSGIAHVASDLSMNPDPNEVIPWVTSATISALEAAAKESSVKRVVLTSSSVAAFTPGPHKPGTKIDEESWNMEVSAAVWDVHIPSEFKGLVNYAASKIQSEMKAWNWVKENKPNFVLNSILPNMNFGRILCPEASGSTMTLAANLLHGDDTAIQTYPPEWYVNVEDTARLHVIALLSPPVQSQRIFALAQPFNWTDVLCILKELRPNSNLPPCPENEPRDQSKIIPSSKAEQMIREFFGRPGWVGLKESLAEGI